MRRKRRKKTTTRVVPVPPKPPGARRLARSDAAAAYSGLPARELFRLLDKNKIKAYKQSHKTVLFDLDSIDAFQNSLPELTHANA